MPRVAVVGHIEWVEFAVVDKVPTQGGVVHALETFQEPAGGGAVAAVQLARLAGGATLFTALGDDRIGDQARERLAQLGVELRAALRSAPTRRAVTLLDADGERTITTLGARLEPSATDGLGWDELADFDAVYVTAGDAQAIAAARQARVLVASPRARNLSTNTGLDALVLSSADPLEREWAANLRERPRLTILTAGARGGRWTAADGSQGSWPAAPLAGAVVDSYGCGDSFAAAFTYGLGRGDPLADALQLAAACGAACLARRGPYAPPDS